MIYFSGQIQAFSFVCKIYVNKIIWVRYESSIAIDCIKMKSNFKIT